MISHRIWQKHHVLPQDLWAMDSYHKAFIYASEFLDIESEQRAERAAARSRS